MSHTIEVNAVGPVVDFEYELSEPGMHVIHGDHGAGKTTILRTVELATGGKVEKPTKMDGAKTGSAVVAGKTLRFGKSVREEGELSLEGLTDLDLAGLHTPKFLSPHTRDAHRIKALARLAGVAADPALFHELLGGKEEFDSVVDADAIATDDLVEMSAKTKRAIEKAALAEERQAETARANLRAKQDQFAGVDFDAPHDEKVLQAAHVKAIETRSGIVQKRKDALATIEAANKAREKIAAAGVSATAVPEAMTALAKATEARCAAESKVDTLRRELSAAEVVLAQAEGAEETARNALEAAERLQDTLAEWRAQVDAAEDVHCPAEQDVAAAEEAVAVASRAVQAGVKVREGMKARSDAGRYAEVAKGHEQAAKRLRDAAAATQDVLSDAIARIPNCPLKVWNDPDGNARLVLETDRSDKEPFDELSDGERYDVLIPMLARNGRIIVLSQAAFGELSPTIRGRVHELARQRGCFVLTAQADSGPLRASPYVAELEAVEA